MTYLSMKACCCVCSAAEKNSFISAELGIIWRIGACTLRWEFEWLGLVVDPGVLIVSELLIKLQGVVSRVLLLATNHTCIVNFKKNLKKGRKKCTGNLVDYTVKKHIQPRSCKIWIPPYKCTYLTFHKRTTEPNRRP